jgi:hypothetical protein
VSPSSEPFTFRRSLNIDLRRPDPGLFVCLLTLLESIDGSDAVDDVSRLYVCLLTALLASIDGSDAVDGDERECWPVFSEDNVW